MYPKRQEDSKKYEYKFWNTQPVIKFDQIVSTDQAINSTKPDMGNLETVTKLPPDYIWVNFDLNNDNDIDEIVLFLNKHYTPESENKFKMHFTSNFLKWRYLNSEYIWLGVRSQTSNILVAIISGIVNKVQLNRNKLDLVECNYMCCHPKLRGKRLVPVLIKELTRQFNIKGYYYGMHLNQNYIPSPILTVNTYHRALNFKTAINSGFVKLAEGMTIKQVKQNHKLPNEPINKNFKKMEQKHLDQCFNLFNTYMDKFNYHPIFTQEQFQHIFLDNKYISCYVLEDDECNVLDFASYFHITFDVTDPSSSYKFVTRGYLFYYTSLNETVFRLIKDLLIIAKNNGVDIMSTTDIMENYCFLLELDFTKGQYLYNYLYNWQSRPLKNIQCSMITY